MQKKIVIFISFFIAHSFVISLCCKENRKTMSGQMVGGLGEAKQATAEEQIIVDSVRAAAESQAGQKFDKFQATLFKTQVVAGTNYFVKVDVGGGKYVHLRVYQPLPYTGHPAELSGVQVNKTADDEITYF